MLTRLLSTLLLLTVCIWCARGVSTVPTVMTDHQMGIRAYSFLISAQDLNSTAYELRVYMRAFCEEKGAVVRLRGFAGAFPVESATPTGLSLFSPHFQPPSLQQHKLQVFSPAANRTTNLQWVGPSNQGLWRHEGKVKPAGGEVLMLQGSYHSHALPLGCKGSLVALGPVQSTPLPAAGYWNVITTTSDNNMSPETLAYLLVLHMQYHERLGFNGTILRCNKGEAQEISVLPHIEALVAAGKLIIWPWVHEHSTGHTPFYWQKPRHQLTLLAAYGHNIQLSFFDLDEYLVLPQGGSLHNTTCSGRPLLQAKAPAWSFARYSARSCHNETDLQCWQDGHALPSTSGVALVFEKCPCRFHKPMVQPDRVLTISVHFVWAWGHKVVDVPPSCGFLIHLHALVNKRGHFMPLGTHSSQSVAAKWVLGPLGSGLVVPRGRSNNSAALGGVLACDKLRKAAGKDEGKKFSLC